MWARAVSWFVRRYSAIRSRAHARSAVTYVELMMVVLIIAILADSARQAFLNQSARAYNSVSEQVLSTSHKAGDAERLYAGAYSPEIIDQLGAAEPNLNFVSWTDELFPLGEISVERASDGEALTLRRLSGSGLGYTWKKLWNGDRAVQYRTRGDDFTTYFNLVRLPSFEDGQVEWSVDASANTVVSQKIATVGPGAPSGANVFEVTARNETGSPQTLALHPPLSYNGAVIPGATYTSSVYASLAGSQSGSVAQIGTRMKWVNGGGGSLSDSAPTVDNDPPIASRRVIATATAPPAAAGVVPEVFVVIKPGQTAKLTVDAAQISATAQPIPYFDGDYPGAQWLDGGNPSLTQRSISTGLAWETW